MTTKSVNYTYPNRRHLPAVDGCVIMRGTYYSPANLAKAIAWARSKIAAGERRSDWEVRYLRAEIERMEMAIHSGRAA